MLLSLFGGDCDRGDCDRDDDGFPSHILFEYLLLEECEALSLTCRAIRDSARVWRLFRGIRRRKHEKVSLRPFAVRLDACAVPKRTVIRKLKRGPHGTKAKRISARNVTAKEFFEGYEMPSQPVIIDHAIPTWENFTLKTLMKHYSADAWRFDDSFAATASLSDYCKYVRQTHHESALGLYDSQFGEHDDPRRGLAEQYDAPALFGEDLFSLCDERPPYRWILVGSPGSGTSLHVDPVSTSAWVTLTEGQKYWAFFPPAPQTDASSIGGLTPSRPLDAPPNPSALNFFRMHPTISGKSWPVSPPIEILQVPGETVFVPAGWMHVVLNLSATVAVTHNWASAATLEETFASLAESEPRFALQFFEAVKNHNQEWADRILDAHDDDDDDDDEHYD